ncbi:MAG: D-tyrosyl-tRNA(Tyr) deacylase [Candidatus Makaraimicrobium thalassicum]|nr:MAG: D-tyrosyl-tRNA(Tyr) deacylase [Candidatus Omnitrophota bacterium]
MKIVLQRVKEAAVSAGGEERAAIKRGFLLLVGIGREDTPGTVEEMARKISRLRVFEDEQGKMNLDLGRVDGGVLSIPQFTLLGKTEKGNRPGFELAAVPAKAKPLWERFNDALRSAGIPVAEGEFGAHMEVSLVNDGPVTFVLDSTVCGK